jgi:enoyl-CoA hydratase/carnithine racemase
MRLGTHISMMRENPESDFDMSILQCTQDGIRTTREGAILEVTLDRPKANAIDVPASRRLNAIFTAFRDESTLRVAIVTGTGEKFFSPGWDLKNAAQRRYTRSVIFESACFRPWTL